MRVQQQAAYWRGRVVLGYEGVPGKGRWVVVPALPTQKVRGRRRVGRGGAVLATEGGAR